ncbi:hypothetical protein [Haloimpatiens massiliensis]|uniref:hypothetical protein n=1 Tax=Haloimpatiens massiliensis TaxID=1658110 RepID=UPI000C82D865|nr:hypothetical protein [Haloimpatiens massiliensis]
MSTVLNKLNNIKILDKEDIVTIKNYIDNKYSENVSSKNSQILSHTISSIIYNNLKGLPEELKSDIKKEVLVNLLINGKKIVTFKDVFEICINYNGIRYDLPEKLVDWISLNTKMEFTTSDLQQCFKDVGFKDINVNISTNEDKLINQDISVNQNKFINENICLNNQYELANKNTCLKDQYELVNENSCLKGRDELANENSYLKYKKELANKNLCSKDQAYKQNNENTLLHSNIEEYKKSKNYLIRELLYWKKFKKIQVIVIVTITCIILLGGIGKAYYSNVSGKQQIKENTMVKDEKNKSIASKYVNSHMPKYMRYKKINEVKLKEFLCKRSSLLAEEPYFSTILSIAEEFNVNPILLFSITGQEQNFVPKNSANSKKIANNPFNVYHSWMEYNTDIDDSTKIASRTIINLSKNMPKDEDPFNWIGKRYAQDKGWSKGVKAIFKELTEYVK